jgi:hypothetical protein
MEKICATCKQNESLSYVPYCCDCYRTYMRDYMRRRNETPHHDCPNCDAVVWGKVKKYCSKSCQRDAHYKRSRERTRLNQVDRDCFNCGQAFRTKRLSDRCCSKRCCDRASLLQRYGLTPSSFLEMLERQGGKCGICQEEFGLKGPQIDHVHPNNHDVRGILCTSCNLLVGHAKDDLGRLHRAGTYMARHELDLRDLCAA